MTDQEKNQSTPRKHQRKLRNLLIDKSYQLRYIFTSIFLTILLFIGLGSLVFWQGRNISNLFKQQQKDTTKLFTNQQKKASELMDKRYKLNRESLKKILKTATDMLDVQLKDKDSLVREAAALAKKDLLADDQKRLKQRQELDKELLAQQEAMYKKLAIQRRKQEKQTIETQTQQAIFFVGALIGICSLFLVLLFFYNLLLTHKSAGPLFKMGRYLDELKDGKISELHSLRKGDQLTEFYERFQEMYKALRERTQEDIEILQKAVSEAENQNFPQDLQDSLQALLSQKQESIQDTEQEKDS